MGRRARVQWRADAVADAVRDQVMRNADRAGDMLAGKIRGAAPRSAGGGHMPGGGHAADSATHQVTEITEGVRVSVGFPADAFYMAFLEDGTSRQAAQPTVRPVVLESKAEVLGVIAGG